MECRICGSEQRVYFYHAKGQQALCESCAKNTPSKIGPLAFAKKYWGKDWKQVPASTRHEFYDDYRASNLTYEKYEQSTTQTV